MKKPAILALIFLLLVLPFAPIRAKSNDAAFMARLSGRILLQVESYGRAWYVYPKTLARYYLKNGDEAFALMRNLGLGISNADFFQIPTKIGEKSNPALVERVKGYIVLQVEDKGQAWYVNPEDGLRYYLKNGDDAYTLMRSFSLGVKDTDLRKISMNGDQIVFDPVFSEVAYVRYDGEDFKDGAYADTILPLASLTKLMAAFVLVDIVPNWSKRIIFTREQLEYPALYARGAKTSEIDFKEGDTVSMDDLFVALLVASSNQAAIALVDASGYTREDFAALMNKKALELGLVKTHFFEPSGLDANNVSTSKEMAIIAKAAFGNPKIAATSAITEHICAVTNKGGIERGLPVANRNYSLLGFNPDASKTGFLEEAQRTVVLKKGDAIVVVLHARSMGERNRLIKKLLN